MEKKRKRKRKEEPADDIWRERVMSDRTCSTNHDVSALFVSFCTDEFKFHIHELVNAASAQRSHQRWMTVVHFQIILQLHSDWFKEILLTRRVQRVGDRQFTNFTDRYRSNFLTLRKMIKKSLFIEHIMPASKIRHRNTV